MLQKGLTRSLKDLHAKEKKQKADLLKLMKDGGDPVIVDMKTETLSKLLGSIRKLTLNQARLEQFAEKIDEAHTQQRIGANMVNVTNALGRVARTMALDKLEATMMDLGKQYEDIDVMTSVLDSTTAETTAQATSPEEIFTLQKQLADEAGLEFRKDLNSASPVTSTPMRTEPSEEALAESSRRLKELRQHA